MVEAYVGLGDETRAQEMLDGAKAQPGVDAWMIKSTEEQLAKLKELLAKSPLRRITSGAVQ